MRLKISLHARGCTTADFFNVITYTHREKKHTETEGLSKNVFCQDLCAGSQPASSANSGLSTK